MKSNFYPNAIGCLRKEVQDAVGHELLKELHVVKPWRHYLLLGRQYVLLALGFWLAASFDQPWLWIPGAFLAGFTVFNFTVFLHEVVHHCVHRSPSSLVHRLLGMLYAVPSGISASQFERWHMDHHQELGSPEDDPKRHYLSPKINARWYKALYCTPFLIPLYFRAARREMASYPAELRHKIRGERLLTIALHLGVAGSIWAAAGPWTMFKVYVTPFLLVFPIAFTLNRLGQHYFVDPKDPAKWSTLMKANRFWDFAFCFSNYHIEHHYFPRVPFYNLRRLHFALQGFYAQRGLRACTYSWILWQWFVKNRAPHTNWNDGSSYQPTTS
ncbi:MAG: fatty acid desaturase [Planctomycetes bacterium]|nr:fatty acid desaturase [Planctomycetota bacterium]